MFAVEHRTNVKANMQHRYSMPLGDRGIEVTSPRFALHRLSQWHSHAQGLS